MYSAKFLFKIMYVIGIVSKFRKSQNIFQKLKKKPKHI